MNNVTSHRRGSVARRAAGGFTLVELLVVIGIIVILASILTPSLMRALKTAKSTRQAADLQAIATALEAYRADFSDYPRLPAPANRNPTVTVAPNPIAFDYGEFLLAWALVGPYDSAAAGVTPGDGNDGLGFRIRAGQGRVYGPYLQADKIRTSKVGNYYALLDRSDNPILYYTARTGTRPTLAAAADYVSATTASLYNSTDCAVSLAGPIGAAAQKANFTGPFILWSSGPDGTYGNKDDVSNIP